MVNPYCPNCRIELKHGSCQECGFAPGVDRQARKTAPRLFDPLRVPNRYAVEIEERIAAHPEWMRNEAETSEEYRARMLAQFRAVIRRGKARRASERNHGR